VVFVWQVRNLVLVMAGFASNDIYNPFSAGVLESLFECTA